ncbi:hypothetical protein [Labrys wisconsinensis]|uniref:Tetratricopeptide repeat protein n=1 Tax=Labrys wisconsinensis TaxID=425677 RepID=A0ABU0JAY4_9HYPH|nr:hypothetical protein [Labrys wisconsinensis]MDQ0471426.1 hypothetical protein [Labrys wisconsinensis]
MIDRAAPRQGVSMRSFARGPVRLLLAGLVLCAALAHAPAAAQDPVSTGAVQASAADGHARLIFQFGHMPDATTRVANGVLVIDFAGKVKVPVDGVAAAVSDYVSGARLDPDGRAIRLALAQRLTVHAMPAGERLFVDLLPASWQGPPPSLPPEIIAELTAKAREAERLRQEEQARIALARSQTRPLELGIGRQPTFTRLAFRLQAPVPVRLARAGQSVEVTFDAALKIDLAPVKAELPPRLTAIDAEARDARLTVKLQVGEGADIRAFWDGSDYVVDLTGAIGGSAGLPAVLAGLAQDEPGDGGTTTLASTAALAPPAMRPVIAEPETVPAASSSPPAVQAPARPAAAPPQPQAVAPPPAQPVSPPAQPAAPPPVAAPRATGPLQPTVKLDGRTVRLGFPFDRQTPGAVYRRGDTLWLVFDTDRKVDVGAIAAAAKDVVADAAATAADGAVIVRLKLKVSPLVTTSPDGTGWIVSIGDDILGAAQPVALKRVTDAAGRASVTAELDGVGAVHRIADPDVGDTVFVATAPPPARGFLKPQGFVEFRTLVTAHGLAFVPVSDDVVVSAGIDTVIVRRDGGLTVSGDGATAGEDRPRRGSVVDTGRWAEEVEAPFRAREQALIAAAAEATDQDRLAARIDLARFYLAKEFGAEAAAVLDVAGADDQNAAQNREYALLKAAARVLMGRGEEATAILADHGLAASAEGALWHGLAELAGHHPKAAHDAFLFGDSAVGLYPKPVQARFRLGAYEAAIAMGDMPDATAQRQALDALDVAAAIGPRRALLDARYAELTGHKREALALYGRVADGPAPAVAAEARLRSLPLRRDLREIDDKVLLDGLETLAATWRGDEVEAQTLDALTQEYLKAGKDRQAFDAMQVAIEHFPGSDATRAMQDRMQRRFIELFLADGAAKLPPVEALALFYDYRDLTPGDRRGDEMIRKLADRLVEVDLLDQAAALLQHQIDNRLTGAARAQVAAKLAMIELMNRKPGRALQALSATRQSDLPRELTTSRLLLEARALAETARPDLALEILDQLDSPEVPRLRADILWQARRWPAAAAAIENQLGDCWQGPEPLNEMQRGAALRAAIAYSLADDRIGLDRLRTKFAAKMADSADAASFETVTAPIESRGGKFSDIAREIAASDTLDAFLRDYRARYMGAPSAPAKPAAALVDPAAPGAG